MLFCLTRASDTQVTHTQVSKHKGRDPKTLYISCENSVCLRSVHNRSVLKVALPSRGAVSLLPLLECPRLRPFLKPAFPVPPPIAFLFIPFPPIGIPIPEPTVFRRAIPFPLGFFVHPIIVGSIDRGLQPIVIGPVRLDFRVLHADGHAAFQGGLWRPVRLELRLHAKKGLPRGLVHILFDVHIRAFALIDRLLLEQQFLELSFRCQRLLQGRLHLVRCGAVVFSLRIVFFCFDSFAWPRIGPNTHGRTVVFSLRIAFFCFDIFAWPRLGPNTHGRTHCSCKAKIAPIEVYTKPLDQMAVE